MNPPSKAARAEKRVTKAWAIISKRGRIPEEMKWAGAMCIFRSRANAAGALFDEGERVVEVRIHIAALRKTSQRKRSHV